jgi:hypothetical protein
MMDAIALFDIDTMKGMSFAVDESGTPHPDRISRCDPTFPTGKGGPPTRRQLGQIP